MFVYTVYPRTAINRDYMAGRISPVSKVPGVSAAVPVQRAWVAHGGYAGGPQDVYDTQKAVRAYLQRPDTDLPFEAVAAQDEKRKRKRKFEASKPVYFTHAEVLASFRRNRTVDPDYILAARSGLDTIRSHIGLEELWRRS